MRTWTFSLKISPSDSLTKKSLEGTESGLRRGAYLYLLNVFCSLGLQVGSCSSSTIKWEKQSREGGSHAGAGQDFYRAKLVWHHLLTGDFACKTVKIHLNLRDVQMKDWNRWTIWHHGFMTCSSCVEVHKMSFERWSLNLVPLRFRDNRKDVQCGSQIWCKLWAGSTGKSMASWIIDHITIQKNDWGLVATRKKIISSATIFFSKENT